VPFAHAAQCRIKKSSQDEKTIYACMNIFYILLHVDLRISAGSKHFVDSMFGEFSRQIDAIIQVFAEENMVHRVHQSTNHSPLPGHYLLLDDHDLRVLGAKIAGKGQHVSEDVGVKTKAHSPSQ
jgi:hypothetical protein